jgi:uncharacterized membrane protein YeaQ/YmgE (transglycosylase-associated protein family)
MASDAGDETSPQTLPDHGVEVGMSVIGWIILGLIAGFIASKIVNRHGEGIVMDIVIGIVGAVIGGWLMAAFGGGVGVNGLNLYSMFVAVAGAVILLLVVHAVRRAF